MSKSYKGQSFPPVITAEDVHAAEEAQKPFDKEGAVSIETYFAQKNIRDVVQQAAMRAYSSVRRATPDDWDSIFKSYYGG